MEKDKNKLLIIDGNSILYRAYHALPPLSTQKGEIVGAVYGFLLAFFKAIKDFHPNFIAACFDFPAPTFRSKLFKGYKAKRPPMPEDLRAQIPKIKRVLEALNVLILEKKGFEADDLIGTVVDLFLREQRFFGGEGIILSGDMDTLQLVSSRINVCLLRGGVKNAVVYNTRLVEEKYQGLGPEQLLDFKALKGDASDNIPGAPGVGEKTAITLIKKFRNIENLYKKLESSKDRSLGLSPKLKETLLTAKEQVFCSKRLAEINKSAPIEFCFKGARWGGYNKENIVKIFKEYEFHNLLNRLNELLEGGQKEKGQKREQALRLW